MNIETGKIEKEIPYVMEYIRRKTKAGNIKIGVVVAALVDGKIKIGWSLAKQKGSETDTFERTEGLQRSFERILSGKEEVIPATVQSLMRDRYRIQKLDKKTRRCVRDVNGKPVEYTRYGIVSRANRQLLTEQK